MQALALVRELSPQSLTTIKPQASHLSWILWRVCTDWPCLYIFGPVCELHFPQKLHYMNNKLFRTLLVHV